MLYMILVVMIFLILLGIPFFNAWLCSRKKGTVLHIAQEYTRDARYFGKSFARMVRQNLSSVEDGTIFLSRPEGFVDANTEKLGEEANEVVICMETDFVSSEQTKVFTKEIYGGENVEIHGGGVNVRAVYAGKKMILGPKTDVTRWIDAEETVAVYDGCNLGISASAGQTMCIGKHCTFRRLYAPEILIGQYPDRCEDVMRDRDGQIFAHTKNAKVRKNLKYVDKKLLDGKTEADFTVLSKYSVMVLEGIILQGDLRSHKDVRICDDAVVCGNVFTEGNVYVGKRAVVLGHIFSQGDVIFEQDAMVGQRGKLVSVIARKKIVFQERACVFGYVSCEAGGMIKSADVSEPEPQTAYLIWDRKEEGA